MLAPFGRAAAAASIGVLSITPGTPASWAQEDPPPEPDSTSPWDIAPISPEGLAAGAVLVTLSAGVLTGRAIGGDP